MSSINTPTQSIYIHVTNYNTFILKILKTLLLQYLGTAVYYYDYYELCCKDFDTDIFKLSTPPAIVLYPYIYYVLKYGVR